MSQSGYEIFDEPHDGEETGVILRERNRTSSTEEAAAFEMNKGRCRESR